MLLASGIIALLILLTALFVAAEFAAVGARRSRLRRLAEDGNALAARIRAHEDKFEWTLQPVMSKGTAPLPLPRLGAAALVLVLAAAAWWMGGRALRARRSGVSRPGQRDPDLDGQ